MGDREQQAPGWALEASIELLRRARSGDDAALDRLFRRYGPPLRRFASGRLPVWAREGLDTEDMVQDTLLRTFTKIEDFEPERDGALQAYLRQAMRHRVVDELRRAVRRPRATEVPAGQPDDQASPLEQAIGSQAVERFDEALGRLKEEDREAIVARIEMGMGYREVAQALGKPSANAARMAVSRALVRLAREMRRDET